MRGHSDRVNSATFSPDGKRIVTASYDGTTRIWDATSGKQQAVLHGMGGPIQFAAFRPDGKRIVVASSEGTARIWRAASGTLRAVMRGHGEFVNSVAFDLHGERIVTASRDRTARVWQAASGRQLAVLRGHGGKVYSATFSPDGKRILTTSEDKTARIWSWEDPREVEIQLRIDTARQMNGFRIVPETLLDPGVLGQLPSDASPLEARGPSRYPSPRWIASARDAVLAAKDPALAWLSLYRDLARAPRANAWRLFVLEAIERALQAPGAKLRPVLALALAATRGDGLLSPDGSDYGALQAYIAKGAAFIAELRKRAQALAEKGHQHPVVHALASGN